MDTSIHYYQPWPGPIHCELCGQLATISTYDKESKQTLISHADQSLKPCRTPGGSGESRSGNTFTFPVTMGAEFDTVDSAIKWGQHRVGGGVDPAMHFGYVRASAGHRKIGALKSAENALAIVEMRDGTLSVTTP